ncbi:O-antigen ligase family protein [Niallia sp. Man26]|uniref:O-antigen ligase family protein n=1 Tax=Niallia sp. Man26 TaxID=2912824 RepID=UPI001EDA9036|nr:O-antigen ligase family protein [Niallia sp. Man26]UPO87343.1 O-antigen ligase family protein [Niallia sp. Man26]
MLYILLGFFYSFLAVLNPFIQVFFLSKYGALLFLSIFSSLLILLKLSKMNEFEKRIFNSTLIMFLIFFIPSLYMFLYSSPIGFSIEKTARVLLFAPLFLLIVIKRFDYRNYFIFFSLVFSFIALIQMAQLTETGRVTSLFYHSNFYSIYIVILIIFLLEKIVFTKSKRIKIFYSAYILLNIIIVLLGTGSRTSFAIIIMLILYSIISWSKNKLKSLFYFLGMILSSVVLFIIFKDRLFETRIFNLSYGNVYSNQEDSFTWRIGRWESGIEGWLNTPFITKIFGTGWETSAYLDKSYYGYAMHNEYLRMLMEFGGVGFLVFLFVIISLFVIGIRNFRKQGNFSLTLIMITILISCFTENIFIASESFAALILSIAVCLGIILNNSDKDLKLSR